MWVKGNEMKYIAQRKRGVEMKPSRANCRYYNNYYYIRNESTFFTMIYYELIK